jgi:hypothetical protein
MKNFLKKIGEKIFFIINPSFWIMNYNYSKEWDVTLNFLLDNSELLFYDFDISCHVIEFKWKEKEILVWVKNYPYAYGVPYQNLYNRRPSRHTILKLSRFVKKMKDERNR